MASKVILHIGQQKSGTTYLQAVLASCAGELADRAGVLFPPSLQGVLPGSVENHERATYGLLGTEYPWVTAERAAQHEWLWNKLIARVREWPGTALVSAEALSVVREAAARRIVEELGDVEVVITTRGLGRSLPSLWQQHVRNGRGLGVEQYFAGLIEQRERGERAIEDEHELHVWRAFALGRLVRRWDAVAPGAVTVVVNRGEGLWTRFCDAAGIAEHADLPGPDVLAERTHAGMTLPEIEAMVHLNRAIEAAGWPKGEARAVRERIVHGALAPRDDRGPRAGVPESAREAVLRWSEEDIDDLAATGVRVVGELDELRFRPDRDVHAGVSADHVARAAAAALVAVAERPRTRPHSPARRTLYRRLRSRGSF